MPIRLGILLSLSLILTGCATVQMTTYKPIDGQSVTYEQGTGSITVEAGAAMLTMYPTFKYQSASDIPTFTLYVQNRSDHAIDFDPAGVQAWLDATPCHVYTLEERVGEIRSSAKRKQIALALLGAAAAGAAAYSASHTTTTYSGYAVTPRGRAVYTSGTIQTYDPAAGLLAGAAVGAATGVGIHQIDQAAGHEEAAAQGIFQRTTIPPGVTMAGQVMLKTKSKQFGTLRLVAPVEGGQGSFAFTQATARY
jgi:hypothetical protein